MSEEKLLSTIHSVSSNGYYTYGGIPAKQLSSAYTYYNVEQSDSVLALIDSTIMGSAKNGMAITLKGVYWKNGSSKKRGHSFIPWKVLVEENRQITKSVFSVNLGQNESFDMSGASLSKDELVCLLVKLINLYREYPFEAVNLPPPESVVQDGDNDTEKGEVEYKKGFVEKLARFLVIFGLGSALLAFLDIGYSLVDHPDPAALRAAVVIIGLGLALLGIILLGFKKLISG